MKNSLITLSAVFVFAIPHVSAESLFDKIKRKADEIIAEQEAKADQKIDQTIDETVDSAEQAVYEGNAAESNTSTGTSASTNQTAATGDNANVMLVKMTQAELKRLGYPVAVDGQYGPGTRNAILAFEADQGLSLTGNVSPELFNKLKSANSPQQPTAQANTSAQPTNSSNNASLTFDQVPMLLLRIKYKPESVSEEELRKATEKKFRYDQMLYKQIEDLKKNIQSLQQANPKHVQIARNQQKIEEYSRKILFTHAQVQSTNLSFTSRQLAPQYHQHLKQIASQLPETFRIEYEWPLTSYTYDFDNKVLYNRGLTWSPCSMHPYEMCLPNGWGGHFFLRVGSPNFAVAENHLVTPVSKTVSGSETHPLLQTMIPSTSAGPQFIAYDRIINIPYLSMPAEKARTLTEPLPTNQQQQGAGAAQSGPYVPPPKQVLTSTIYLRVTDIVSEGQIYLPLVTPTRVEINHWQKGLVKSYSADEFTSSSQLGAAAQKAEREQQLAEADRKASFQDMDIVGIKLGMSLEEADKIVRKHMQPMSVYRYSRQDSPKPYGAEPFGRSMMYIKFGEQPDPAKSEDTLYWGANRPHEVITLIIEANANGKDEVMGIWRSLLLPKDVNRDALRKSLIDKYGEPLRKQGNFATWAYSNTYSINQNCQPKQSRASKAGRQLVSGTEIPSHAKNLWNVWLMPSMMTTNTRWKDMVESEDFLEECGPTLYAFWTRDDLQAILGDYRAYFLRYRELFVKDKLGPEKKSSSTPSSDIAL
jgi:peptidoglycan hydrolase-like protein with peptidoglycan-binding domain